MNNEVLNTAFTALVHDICPQDQGNPLLNLADQMAAGGGNESINQSQLRSIFDNLGANRTTGKSHWLPLKRMGADRDAIFPDRIADNPMQNAADLKAKIKQTASELTADSETDLEQLLFTLERYGWCLPSGIQDVSAYDRARMRAAIAVCLLEVDPLPKDWKDCDDQLGLLIGGEISGIQKFIYTITDKDAAKSLRGRSFFIQALTESILRFILRELDIPYTAVIYNGGGIFTFWRPVQPRKNSRKFVKKSRKSC